MKRFAPLALLVATAAHAAGEPAQLETYTVTATRASQPASASVFSVSRLDGEELRLVGATHPSEVFVQIPGAWVSRGNGQEHLTAIRSPVLTGAGACGAFLFLEDGIPVRPAGFCNVNQLFEINTEQADRLEVLRGPGSVLYGSNAMHGVINVLHAPLRLPMHEAALTAGEYGLRRAALDYGELIGENSLRVKYFGETAGGVQRDSGHEQHKLNIGFQAYDWRAHFAATTLDQDTAGYVVGEDAFRDSTLRRMNLEPDAYRRAHSVRAWAVWERELPRGKRFDLRPYARYSDMEFVQHFLPGAPREENGQTSAGVIATVHVNGLDADWSFGTDLEIADGWLRETQDEPVTEGSDFLRETRPVGRHYDYEVRQSVVSPWMNLDYRLADDTDLVAGFRIDALRYDYDNRMSTGNARDDGSACGFGGCIYNRPADRRDEFVTLSPKLGLRHRFETFTAYANAVRGFRVPQATELYRLQRGQDVAELDAPRIDSVEAGVRGGNEFRYDIALFAMEKRDEILRDAEGFNVTRARTRHRGVEFDLEWHASDAWQFALRGTYARHTYAFDYQPADGEQFRDGDDVDTAPRWLGSAIARWNPSAESVLELEYAHTGAYFLDAQNTQRYPGHDLWNLRWQQRFDDFDLRVRVNNLLDEEYAERADFAFGEHRYFPGWPRRLVVETAFTF